MRAIGADRCSTGVWGGVLFSQEHSNVFSRVPMALRPTHIEEDLWGGVSTLPPPFRAALCSRKSMVVSSAERAHSPKAFKHQALIFVV